MKPTIRRLSLVLFLASALLFFATQRYGLWPRFGLSLSALLGLGIYIVDSVSLWKSEGLDRNYLKVVLFWKSAWIMAAVFYLASRALPDTQESWPKILLALSAVFVVLGGFVGFGIESDGLRPFSFDGQDAVSRRWRSSLSLGLILVALIGINYVAAKKDKAFDLTFLKASVPGDASRKIVERLDHPLRVGLFFSKESEVLPLVREYFQELASDKLTLEYYDKDFNPTQAEEFRVAKNGQIVVMDGDKRQRFDVGDRIEEGRRNLRTLDGTFQKSVLQLTSEPAIIYFTATHGEMLWESGSPLRSIAALEELLRGQNFKARRLTAMFQEIPEEAKILVIMGPTTGFAREDIDALSRYIARGGRILLALDIDRNNETTGNAPLSFNELPSFLDSIGLHFKSEPVAHDERFVPSARQKSDRYFVFTNKFARHPSTAVLNANSDKLMIMSFRSGSWEIAKESKDWRFQPTISTITGSFIDANGNFEADKNEIRGNYPLVVAGESQTKAKLLAFADASIFSDTLMKSPGNQFAALDAIRWLSDRTEESGAIESEEDVLIRHENAKEILVFHGSIYLVPLLILAFGLYVNRRKKGLS